MADGEERELQHLNHALVKQLATIRADGGSLSRRLQDLRAASASLCRSSSEEIKNAAPPAPAAAAASTDHESSTSGCIKSAAVVRSSRRRDRDSLFNEDIAKLLSLSKLMTEENHRLQALNSSFQAEVNQLKSGAAEARALMQQRLDESTKQMEILAIDNERLRQENAASRDHRQVAITDGSQESLIAVLQREASGMLKFGDEEEQQFVTSELHRLAMEFVQGVIQVEEELLKRTSAKEEIHLQFLHQQQQQQQESGKDQIVAGDDHQECKLLRYVLPVAALSGALAAIVVSLRVSSTAASTAGGQQSL